MQNITVSQIQEIKEKLSQAISEGKKVKYKNKEIRKTEKSGELYFIAFGTKSHIWNSDYRSISKNWADIKFS